MGKSNGIEKELIEATDTVRKNDEDDQDYYRRLIDAVTELSDDDWEVISTPAQKWVNAGVKSIEDSSPIADFDGEVIEPDDKSKPQNEQEHEMSSRKKNDNKKAPTKGKTSSKGKAETKKGKGNEKNAAAGNEDKSESKERKPRARKEGKLFKLAVALLEQPDGSYEDISKKLAKDKVEVTESSYTAYRGYVGLVRAAAESIGILRK